METVWRIMSDYLHFLHHAFGVRILSFTLMENHFHLIARFPNVGLSESMQYFMRETSRAVATSSGRINHVYGARVFRSRISSDHHLRTVYKYVYRNSVEANIVENVEDYRYSTLPGILGATLIWIPLEFDFILFSEGISEVLAWLNTRPSENSRQAVKLALRAQTFRLAKLPKSGRAHPLELLLY